MPPTRRVGTRDKTDSAGESPCLRSWPRSLQHPPGARLRNPAPECFSCRARVRYVRLRRDDLRSQPSSGSLWTVSVDGFADTKLEQLELDHNMRLWLQFKRLRTLLGNPHARASSDLDHERSRTRFRGACGQTLKWIPSLTLLGNHLLSSLQCAGCFFTSTPLSETSHEWCNLTQHDGSCDCLKRTETRCQASGTPSSQPQSPCYRPCRQGHQLQTWFPRKCQLMSFSLSVERQRT